MRGHEGPKEFLSHALQSNRLATSLLFEGAEGIGKERLALALAQRAMCASAAQGVDACGECLSCRWVRDAQHPDLLILAKDVDIRSQSMQSESDAKSQITIEKVRELQSERLVYFPQGQSRWVLIRDAHEMNANAANSLLKTLEEPPVATYFVLLTHRPSELLITVRSRCQRVRFAPLSDDDLSSVLEARGVEAALRSEIVALSEGSVSNAVALAKPDVLASRQAWRERFLSALRGGRPGGIVDIAESFAKFSQDQDDELEAVLTLLEKYFRDEAIAHATDARRATTNAVRAQIVRSTRATVDYTNLKAQSALEELLVRLRDARS